MTLQLLVNGIDRTSAWRVYESRWTSRAWNGESSQSEFLIDDPTGAIDHDDLAARKIVEVWEDASGTPLCLYRGRIANKSLGQGAFEAPGQAMRWTLQCEDFNIDLRGIRVINAVRPAETNYERADVIRLAYLHGAGSTHDEARDSTDLDGNYIGPTPADFFNLDAETYTDTDPVGVLTSMVEQDGHNFFVYLKDNGNGELVYMARSDMALLSDISIVDDAEDENADGVDVFAAYKGPVAGDHAGQQVLTGGAIRYADGRYHQESDVGGLESVYDKWEMAFSNDFITTGRVADDFTRVLVTNADEANTYYGIIDMRPEDAHRIKAGMMVPLIRKRANKLADDAARAVVVTHEPVKPNADGESWYRVTVELGRPRGSRTLPRNRRSLPRPAEFEPAGEEALLGRACSDAGTNFISDYAPWTGENEQRVQINILESVAAGEAMVAAVSWNHDGVNAGRDMQVYDQSGNTWTLDGVSPDRGTPDYFASVWHCNATNALAAGDYVRFAVNTEAALTSPIRGRCIGVYKYPGALSSPNEGANATGFSAAPTVASSTAADITVLAAAIPDDDPTGASGDADWDDMVPYSRVNGTGAGMSGIIAQQLQPGGGDAWTGSIDQSRDWSLLSMGYDYTAGGGGSAATSVGSVGGTGEGSVGAATTPPRYIPAGSVLEHSNITVGGPYHEAADVTFSPTGTVSATNVQAAIAEVAAESGGGVPSGTDPGDILAWDGDSWEILPIGTDDDVLTADSGEALGVKWAAGGVGSGAVLPLTAVVDGEPVLVWDENDSLIPVDV